MDRGAGRMDGAHLSVFDRQLGKPGILAGDDNGSIDDGQVNHARPTIQQT